MELRALCQDEWKIIPSLTLNYGLRYDQYQAFDAENQISPRANLVWNPTDTTTVHVGYARYFSPPQSNLSLPLTLRYLTIPRQPPITRMTRQKQRGRTITTQG